MDAHGTAERFVGVIVTVDGGNLGKPLEALSCLLIGGLQVLAVAAPGGIELYNLSRSMVSSVSPGARITADRLHGGHVGYIPRCGWT